MIIPQIGENLTGSNTLEIPKHCPVCGGATRIEASQGAKTLYCTNPDCIAKQTKGFEHFVTRNAMNIEGISEQTLEKFIDCGFIKTFKDLYHLDRYREDIVNMEGFGVKSYDNIIDSVNQSRLTTLAKVIYGLGIAGIGLANAKLICNHFDEDVNKVVNATKEELLSIAGIGEVLSEAFCNYFKDETKNREFFELLEELTLKEEEKNTDTTIAGKVFVITGSVNHFANRDEVKALIESLGAKVTGSVTSKTDYLINNDTTSNSSKNKKAKELNIPIISEEDFLTLIGRN